MLSIEIVPVPTARAADGLALSSRNGYLNEQERALATGLYQTLQEIAAALQAGDAIASALNSATERLNGRGFVTDYLEVRRQADLQPATAADRELVILGAAVLGPARLIDNLQVTLNRADD